MYSTFTPGILLIAFSPILIKVEGRSVPGAPVPAQLNEEHRKELINYAIDTYNNQSNSAYLYKVVNVDSITSQVVNGVIYNLKLEIGETDCRKGDVDKECNLKTRDGSKNLKCEFNILEEPRLNYRSVSVIGCNPKRFACRHKHKHYPFIVNL